MTALLVLPSPGVIHRAGRRSPWHQPRCKQRKPRAQDGRRCASSHVQCRLFAMRFRVMRLLGNLVLFVERIRGLYRKRDAATVNISVNSSHLCTSSTQSDCLHARCSSMVRVTLHSVNLVQALRRHIQRRVRCTQLHQTCLTFVLVSCRCHVHPTSSHASSQAGC